MCDGKKWGALGGAEPNGEAHNPFGTRAAPWGTTCSDILKKRTALKETPKSGVVRLPPPRPTACGQN